jgi:hypothetical protein
MEQYLIFTQKTLEYLAVSYAVPAGSQEATVAINFIGERSV